MFFEEVIDSNVFFKIFINPDDSIREDFEGLKKVVCFLQPCPNKFLFKKIPSLKFFSSLLTPNNVKHA